MVVCGHDGAWIAIEMYGSCVFPVVRVRTMAVCHLMVCRTLCLK